MRDFPTHCKEIIYPLFESLMNIKRGDKLETVKSSVLFSTITQANYIADLDADIFGLELKEKIKAFYNEVTYRKSTRKIIDIMLCDIIVSCGYMLRANNLEFPDKYIYNYAGRISDHYSYNL